MTTPDQPQPYLTKSRFASGNQCAKRLYYEIHRVDLRSPVTEAQQYLFDTGTQVGALARDRFPGGRLIALPPWEHDEAEAETQEALADHSIPAVYEAAFSTDDVRVRPDILVRTEVDAFDLYEVKMSASTKDEHVADVGLQLWVIEQAALAIRRVHIIHINNQFVYQGGAYDIESLLTIEDVTEQAREFATEHLPQSLYGMREMLQSPSEPDVPIGPHCTSPYPCPFFDHCREALPLHRVEHLPGLRSNIRQELSQLGVSDASSIGDIPSSFGRLNALQQRVRDSAISDALYIGPELQRALDQLEYPWHSIDFETFNPALPRYTGTRPYQVIPFQWSLHKVDRDGNIQHAGFLHSTSEDPRKEFLSSLLDSIDPEGSIITYSPYEATRLKSLVETFSEYGGAIEALLPRMVDLAKIVREHFYHPGFLGSFSLKAVLPALVPELDYEHLTISDGQAAAASFVKMIADGVDSDEKQARYDALWEYCQQDTLALVRVIEALRGVGSPT